MLFLCMQLCNLLAMKGIVKKQMKINSAPCVCVSVSFKHKNVECTATIPGSCVMMTFFGEFDM